MPNESNTGNCNKVPTGYGFNLIVPAAGDGAFDLDLANDANPVPEENKQGFWDWTWPPTGKGTFLPVPGQGHYNLFDVDIPVIRFIAKAPLLGEDRLEFQPQNVHPTYILPHWRMECTVTHGPSEETLEMVWWMYAARKITV